MTLNDSLPDARTCSCLCIVAGFILLKIPTMTASLFSGHTGGHGIGMGGMITAALLKGL